MANIGNAATARCLRSTGAVRGERESGGADGAERNYAAADRGEADRAQNAAAGAGGAQRGREVSGGDWCIARRSSTICGRSSGLFRATRRWRWRCGYSQDRLEGLEEPLEIDVDAVMRMLDQSRGDWGDGMFYTGGYEVGVRAGEAGRQEFHAGGQGHLRDGSEQELVWLPIFHRMRTGSTRRWRAPTGKWGRSRRRTGFRR